MPQFPHFFRFGIFIVDRAVSGIMNIPPDYYPVSSIHGLRIYAIKYQEMFEKARQ